VIKNDVRAQKYPLLGYFCFIFIIFVIAVYYLGCAPSPPKLPPELPSVTPVEQVSELTADVIVPQENVREYPNGPIIGKVQEGNTVKIISPKGNWMYCVIGDSLEGCIWAPSLGFPILSFLNIQTYFHGDDHQLRSYSDLEKRLGMPSKIIQESPHYQRIVFDNTMQIGSPPFGTYKFQQLELMVVQPSDFIVQVDIDLGKKETAMSELLTLLGLGNIPPTASGFENVYWDNVFSGLDRVVLDRYQGSFKFFSWIHIYKEHPDHWKDVISILDRSCQIAGNNVTIHVTLETSSNMAYSDILLRASFYTVKRQLIADETIGPLPDVIVSNGQTEVFVDRNVPSLSDRKVTEYNIEIISAKPLFATLTP
jgi:hypothetical protein